MCAPTPCNYTVATGTGGSVANTFAFDGVVSGYTAVGARNFNVPFKGAGPAQLSAVHGYTYQPIQKVVLTNNKWG